MAKEKMLCRCKKVKSVVGLFSFFPFFFFLKPNMTKNIKDEEIELKINAIFFFKEDIQVQSYFDTK